MTTDVQLTTTFPFGSLVRLSASFTREPTQTEIDDGTANDADDWQPIDPDTVSVLTKDPDGAVHEHDYGGSPGDVIRDSIGEFHLDITAAVAGTWTYRFESTGNGQAANEHTFKIAPTAFA